MTPGEFKEIAKSMKEFGISFVKMGNVEIRTEPQIVQLNPPKNYTVSMFPSPIEFPEGVTAEPSDPIKHKVDQMASLMKLSDTDLVDQLFPDKSEEAI